MFPATYTAAVLTRNIVFGHSSGAPSRRKTMIKGSNILVRYNETNGCFDAAATLDGQPMYLRDIPKSAFQWL